MAQIHCDAAEGGASASVLCSTLMGLGLYQGLGYEVLTRMQSFVPVD